MKDLLRIIDLTKTLPCCFFPSFVTLITKTTRGQPKVGVLVRPLQMSKEANSKQRRRETLCSSLLRSTFLHVGCLQLTWNVGSAA